MAGALVATVFASPLLPTRRGARPFAWGGGGTPAGSRSLPPPASPRLARALSLLPSPPAPRQRGDYVSPVRSALPAASAAASSPWVQAAALAAVIATALRFVMARARVWAEDHAPMLGWVLRAVLTNTPGDYHLEMEKTFAARGWPKALPMIPGKVLVSDPDIATHVLVTKDYPKATFYQTLTEPARGCPYLGDGMVTQTDHGKWAERRKQLDKGFTPQRLRAMVPEIDANATRLRDGLVGACAGGAPVETADPLVAFAMDTVAQVTSGQDFGMLEDAFRGEGEAVGGRGPKNIPASISVVAVEMMKQFLAPYRNKLPLVTPAIRRTASAARAVRGYARGVVETRIAEGPQGRQDLLAAVLAVEGITTEGAVDELLTFYLAGADTTARTLAWCLNALAERPEELAKVQAELDAAIPDPSLPITYDTAMSLKHTMHVWNETLRLWTPTPGGPPRVLPEDDGEILPGRVVPKGTDVIVSFWLLHRNPKTWGEDAGEFRPSRWEELGPAASIPGFIPFATGSRNCAGQGFATLEGLIALARLLGPGGCHVTKPAGAREVVGEMQLTLTPVPGLDLLFTPR